MTNGIQWASALSTAGLIFRTVISPREGEKGTKTKSADFNVAVLRVNGNVPLLTYELGANREELAFDLS